MITRLLLGSLSCLPTPLTLDRPPLRLSVGVVSGGDLGDLLAAEVSSGVERGHAGVLGAETAPVVPEVEGAGLQDGADVGLGLHGHTLARVTRVSHSIPPENGRPRGWPHEGGTKVAQELAAYVVALAFPRATHAVSNTYVERAMGLEPTTFSLGS